MITMEAIYDPQTGTMTYLVWDTDSKEAVVIDPVLDYEAESGKIRYHCLEKLQKAIDDQGLTLRYILETHVHADHLSAAHFLKARYHCPIGIGHRVIEVQQYWLPIFGLEKSIKADGSSFDMLLKEGDKLPLGQEHISVIETPGHTPSCVSYRIAKSVFTGDSLFMPNLGTARADFPGGNANTLYQSIQKLFALPKDTQICVGHIYPKPDEPAIYSSSVDEQRKHNIMLSDNTSQTDYVGKREARDKTLGTPKLLLPSLQWNLNAGQFPPKADNGRLYFKIPIQLT